LQCICNVARQFAELHLPRHGSADGDRNVRLIEAWVLVCREMLLDVLPLLVGEGHRSTAPVEVPVIWSDPGLVLHDLGRSKTGCQNAK
jgi:hypothetical protein